MKTLEQIEQEVGKDVFGRWKQRANSLLRASEYRYKEADAQHAFVYSDITRRYQEYIKVFNHHEPRIRTALRKFVRSAHELEEK